MGLVGLSLYYPCIMGERISVGHSCLYLVEDKKKGGHEEEHISGERKISNPVVTLCLVSCSTGAGITSFFFELKTKSFSFSSPIA
jgi:hypothetical protein